LGVKWWNYGRPKHPDALGLRHAAETVSAGALLVVSPRSGRARERPDAVVRDAGVTDTLTYEHLPTCSEPLLWIADAAAWCWTHGRQWPDRVAPVVRGLTTM
jgi:hypothetical protein